MMRMSSSLCSIQMCFIGAYALNEAVLKSTIYLRAAFRRGQVRVGSSCKLSVPRDRASIWYVGHHHDS